MSNPTVAKSNESGLIFQKNKTTNQIEVIASTANMQVGLPNQPADLLITGGVSLSSIDVTLIEGTTYAIIGNPTIVNVTTTGSSGNVTVTLPNAPKKGQIACIKDAGGTAGSISITITGSPSGTLTPKGTIPHLIDDQTIAIIATNYGALQLVWTGSEWHTITSSTGTSAPVDASYVVLGSNATLTNERTLTAGPGISIVDGGAGSTVTISASGVGTGDVIGPASATDNAIARFDLTTGKVIQNSGVTISDTNNITTPGDVAIDGGDLTSTATTFNLLNSTVTTLNVGGAATAVTVGASTADVVVGRAEIGAWPAGTSYAFFGNSDYNHSIAGNYALIQASSAGTKNTWLNAPTGGKVYIANNDAALGYLDDNEISLTGKASTAQTVTLGSTYSNSSTTIQAGTGDISLNSDGSVNLNPTDNAFINFTSNGVDLGSMGYSTFFGGFSTINLTGVSTDDTFLTLGNSYGGSVTSIYAGTGGILLSGSKTIISSSLDVAYYSFSRADARLGNAEVGSWPWGNFNADASHFAMFGNEALDHSIISNYALLQDKLGYTYLNAASGKSLHLRSNNSDYVAINPEEGGSPTDKVVVYKVLSASGGTTTYTDAILGNASIGSWPGYESGAFKDWYAIVGHKNLDHTTSTLKAALAQLYTGDTILNSPTRVYLTNDGNTIGYFDDNEISLTGTASTTQTVTLGSTYGSSSTTIDAGTGDINIGTSAAIRSTNIATGAAQQIVSVGSNNLASRVQITAGEQFLGYGGLYLTGSAGTNYYVGGETATGTITVGRSTDNNTINVGSSGNNTSKIQTINLGAGSGTSIVTIGNNKGLSAISINGGQFGVQLSGSFIVITGSYPSQNLGADATIGAAEIGSLPGFANQYAMFGHQALDHTLGNYAIVQENNGDTWLNAPENGYVYFTSAGNPAYNGYIGYTSLFGTLISLQGRSGQRATVNLGNSTSTSATNIYGGSSGILLSSSAGYTTITGSSSTQSDAIIGDAEIGSLPGFVNQYAMFGHKDLNHAFGNYAIAQKNDGDTWLNASQNKAVYFTSEGNVSYNGYISYSNLFSRSFVSLQGRSGSPATLNLGNLTGDSATNIYGGSGNVNLSGSSISLDSSESGYSYFKSNNNQIGYLGFSSFFNKSLINLQGRSGYATNSIFGNFVSDSTTNIYGGSGGIILSGSNSYVMVTGSTSTSTELVAGMVAIGEFPFTRTSFPNQFAMFGHKSLDNSVNGNYALVQGSNGDTFLNSPSTIYFQYLGSSVGGGLVGTLDNNTVSFTGLSGTATTTTLGNTTGASSTTIDAGTGNINIGTSAAARTINVGPTGAAGVTFAINIGTSTGGGTAGSPRSINIGDYGAGYSAVNLEADYVNIANNAGSALSFYGATPKTKFTVTGSRGGNAALTAVLDVLERLGLINDSST